MNAVKRRIFARNRASTRAIHPPKQMEDAMPTAKV